MDTLILADIFFFVTTIAVVVVGIAFTVALIYLVKVLSDIKKITGDVRDEAVLFREDLRGLRTAVRKEGFRLRSFIGLFTKFFGKKGSERSKKSE